MTDPLAAFRLDGRTCIVTGASAGLGDRFSRVLHAVGANVVLAARRRDRIDALAAELGERAVAVTCDIAHEPDLDRLVDQAVGGFGSVDVLVNNAGTSNVGPAENESTQEFRRMLDVNLVGHYLLSQRVGRHMLVRGSGSIVNIASIVGLVASTPIKQASYCAAKGGLVNLTRELGVQWGRKGVRVNAIAPGWFRSEMTEDTMFSEESSMRFLADNTPMGRGGEPEELDGALLLLASDAGRYMTGTVVTVDGGWTAR